MAVIFPVLVGLAASIIAIRAVLTGVFKSGSFEVDRLVEPAHFWSGVSFAVLVAAFAFVLAASA